MTILVRHAMPDHRADVPAPAWHLGDEGRAAARALVAALPSGAVLVASSEPKAIETIAPAGAVRSDTRLDEVHRVEAYEANFRRVRHDYVGGTDITGWEPRREVVARVGAAVAEHRSAAEDRPLVLAGHGMAWTLWLTAAVGLADPSRFWADLKFPDAWIVDVAARTLRRLDDW